jgi:hypothetical protein
MHTTHPVPVPTLRVLVLIGALFMASLLYAQDRMGEFDTLYVRDYSHILTGRAYLSTKDNAFALRGNSAKDLVYKPNNRVNWGLGASYRALTVNIGIRVPFLNEDNDVYGGTRYFDGQANVNTKRIATNIFLQYYRGYHLGSYKLTEVDWPALAEKPYRPDLSQFNIGFSSLRITNSDRFSFRASFNQDAWQLKSQGSWLVGGYATFFAVRGDSSLVPSALADGFTAGVSMRRGDFYDAGMMLGGVYTWVYKENWFLTLSSVMGMGVAIQNLTYQNPITDLEQKGTNAGVGWRAQIRAGAGYNSSRHYAGISFNQERVGYLLEEQQRFTWNVYNIRLNFVRRFNMKIGFMDRGIRWVRKRVPEPLEQILPPRPEAP